MIEKDKKCIQLMKTKLEKKLTVHRPADADHAAAVTDLEEVEERCCYGDKTLETFSTLLSVHIGTSLFVCLSFK